MKRLFLHENHKAYGAEFGPFGDWELPLHYGSLEKEPVQVRKTGGIIDRSFMGKLLIAGSDRLSFLQGMVTNDVKQVTPEKGIYSLVVTVKGKIVADFLVLGLEEAFLLVLQPELSEKVQTHLDKFVIASDVNLQDVSGQWGLFSVYGPSAPVLLKGVLGKEITQKDPLSVEVHTWNGHNVWLIHQQELGTLGFDILIPQEQAISLWEELRSKGGDLGIAPFGWKAYEVLRIEGGVPRYGYELDESVFPLEAEVENAVSYDKGCFLGQETITRMKFRGHANRLRIGFEAGGKEPPKKGDPILCEGKETGWVTSSAFSPFLQKVVGMGFIRRDFTAPGTPLKIKMKSGETEGKVCSLPLVGLKEKTG
ncbi:MAG TPA: aminomethyltransferase family protein [Nitrospiria bacterium]|jgi:glycine cleavage system T protein